MKSAGNRGVVHDRLQVLHVHVFLIAPLGARHVAQPRAATPQVDKVVLSRLIDITTDAAIDSGVLLERLIAQNPVSYNFHVPLADGGVLLGASPELLLRKDGERFSSIPLAGSARRQPDEVLDREAGNRLLASEKDRHEHELVTQAMKEVLRERSSELHVPSSPQLITTPTLWHLATPFEGKANSQENALTLACLLHPTPALSGFPHLAATQVIAELEPFDRELFGGIVGWCDSEGNGEWVVTIRCAKLRRLTPRKKEYPMQKFLKNLFTAQRCRRAMFFLLFAAVMLLNSSPELRADALYLIADGDTVSVLDGTTDIPQERVIVTGAQSGDAEVTLPAGEKVTVTHGDDIEYATTRNGERVSELLRRLQISVSPLEMVLVDVTEEEVEITVASDFTYYETATEAAPHTTLTSTSYRIPKGETQVVQQGIDGTRDIVYEVVYADGQFVSRQAVEEKNDTSVAEITYTGTLVDKAQSGDTVKSVVTESNGSGYLLMKSGDSVHFSGSMKVTCTAYTAGYGGVGTRTATGTTVHVGTVAVDKKVIPLGTEMFIVGSSGYTYGNAVAEDTGVRGAAIDLYMNSYQECKQFGRQKNSTVYFLD